MESQNDQTPMTVKDWFVTLLIAGIPFIGFIMLFIWGFGKNTNLNKASWAKALLIWIAISIVLGLLVSLLFGAALFSMFNK